MLKFLKPLSFIPAILIMYMIYSFSAQDGMTSSQLSYKVSYKIVETGGKLLGEDWESWQIESIADRFHSVIRKIAHMTEYFALAVAVAFPLYVYGLRGILLMLVAGLFCVAFACGDEYHQSFVSGRSPSKRDVMIDSFGVFWGIIVVRIIGWTGRKTIFRPWGKKKTASYPEQAAPGQFYPGQMSGQPYPGQTPPNQPYSWQPMTGQPYGGQTPPNQPYPRQAPPDQPYPGQAPPNQSYPGQGMPNQTYPGQTPPRQPYPGQTVPNQPYTGRGPSAQPYQNGSAQYQAAPNGGGYVPQYNPHLHQYGTTVPPYGTPQPYGPGYSQPGSFSDADSTSDHLSEDMSLKKLMHDLKEKKKDQHQSEKAHTSKSIPASSRAAAQNTPSGDEDLDVEEFDLKD